jgi:hypothetical protein
VGGRKQKPVEERWRPGAPLRCLAQGCGRTEDVHDVDVLAPAGAGYSAARMRTRLCSRCMPGATVLHDRGPAKEEGSVAR